MRTFFEDDAFPWKPLVLTKQQHQKTHTPQIIVCVWFREEVGSREGSRLPLSAILIYGLVSVSFLSGSFLPAFRRDAVGAELFILGVNDGGSKTGADTGVAP